VPHTRLKYEKVEVGAGTPGSLRLRRRWEPRLLSRVAVAHGFNRCGAEVVSPAAWVWVRR